MTIYLKVCLYIMVGFMPHPQHICYEQVCEYTYQ